MVFKIPKDVSRPPLNTPSASPPHRVPPSRIDVASPSKRQCPSRSSSLHRSVGASDSDLDIEMEREASRARLLDTWSQLAERYSRPLDEDDIVDIRTGEIVKDNGFWRATRRFGFGEVLAPEYQEETATDESGDEDGVDELDAFTEEHDYLEDVFLERGLQRPPPKSSNVDFEYGYDLKEFLEAEERRKEKYGSDLEEYEESEGEEDDAQNLPGTSSTVCSEDSDSDDELDNWAPTEASKVDIVRDEEYKKFRNI